MENTICKSCGNEIPAGNPFCPSVVPLNRRKNPSLQIKIRRLLLHPSGPLTPPNPSTHRLFTASSLNTRLPFILRPDLLLCTAKKAAVWVGSSSCV